MRVCTKFDVGGRADLLYPSSLTVGNSHKLKWLGFTRSADADVTESHTLFFDLTRLLSPSSEVPCWLLFLESDPNMPVAGSSSGDESLVRSFVAVRRHGIVLTSWETFPFRTVVEGYCLTHHFNSFMKLFLTKNVSCQRQVTVAVNMFVVLMLVAMFQ